jgi:transposase
VEHHRALWRSAGEQVRTLDRSLAQQRAASAGALDRLETIPGVGPIVAATIVAVFSDVTRFPSAKHAATYAGLVPATYHSGDREAYGAITKRGADEVRAMLCEAAHHASRSQHPLNVEEGPFTRTAVRRYRLKTTLAARA